MYLTSCLIFKPGGFTGSAGTPNYLQSLDNYDTQVQWNEAQIGAFQSATIRNRIAYTNVMDLQAGNWVVFGCYGGTTSALSAGATSLTVSNCTDASGNPHLESGDSILVSDGVNAEIFKAASVTYSGSTATIGLGAAVSQNTTALLNAYPEGARVTKLQWQGIITGRKRTTDLSNIFTVLVSGMMWRYQKIICDVKINASDAATSIYNLCNTYAPQVPEIIVNSANFAPANNIIYTGSGTHTPLATLISDILKTESGGAVPSTPYEATFWSVWVDELRQVHHGQIPTQNTSSPTFTLDLVGGSPNLYPNSDTLSDSTLTGLTKASGGPGGATDAEYTGTGSAVGSNATLSRVMPVTPGQTYTPSFWVDPSQVTNLASNVVQVGLNDVAGEAIESSFVTSTTAGRFATSAWTCPTNLAPNSDNFAGWNLAGGPGVGSGGPSGAEDIEVSGTGSPSGYQFANSGFIPVTAGVEYVLSLWVDSSQISQSGSSPYIAICDTNLNHYTDNYFGVVSPGRISLGPWMCPAGTTQVKLLLDSNDCTIASGQKLKFSQPMLEPRSSASGYYISSQNPQVQMYAQLDSSAIVANGQKFKVSQPMLTARGISGDYNYTAYQAWRPTNAYGDVLGPIQPQDMDMTRLLNCVLVEGGKDANGNVIDIVLTVKPSYEEWGYYQGFLSNPNITQKQNLATWAAGQVGVLAWPQQTGKLDLVVASTRMTSRDLLQVTGFDDGSTLITNPISIQYTADMKAANVTASASLTQQQPNESSVMREIAGQRSIREREIHNGTALVQSYIVSGLTVTTSGLNWSVAAGSVIYNGTSYSIPAQNGSLAANDTIRLGVQCQGTPPTGYALPCTVPMPSFGGSGGVRRMSAHEWFELQPPVSGNYLTLVQQTDFQGLYLATLSADSANITVTQNGAAFGGVGTNNLKPPTAGSPTIATPNVALTAEGAASARAEFSLTLSGITFDDTIASVDVVRSFAGANQWGLPFPATYAPANGNISFTDHGLAAGQGYDYGLIVRGRNGQALNTTPVLIGSSPTINAATIKATILGYNVFGGTLESDGAWTGVDGHSSSTQYTLATSQPFTVSGDIQRASTSEPGALILGTTSNGYGVVFSGGYVSVEVYVNNVTTTLQAASMTDDTNLHSYRLTVTPGSPNTIEGSVDSVLVSGVDSSITL